VGQGSWRAPCLKKAPKAIFPSLSSRAIKLEIDCPDSGDLTDPFLACSHKTPFMPLSQNPVAPQSPPAELTGEIAVAMNDVQFSWEKGGEPDLTVTDLRIPIGERLFIGGPSGCGKSTLLGLLAGVTTPQTGTVSIMGKDLSTLGSAQRDQFRADHLGYLFQMFNLIPYLSVLENTTLPLRFSPNRRARVGDPTAEASRLLNHLGMADFLDRPVTKLSVGQQQRVAAARALIGAPEIVLADEPTSALDAGHSEGFIELLFEECARAKSTLIFVSHDTSLAPLFHRTVDL
jgi:putative ABC transport system ATP-binding protein